MSAVAVDRAQPRRVGQHGGPVGQGRLRPAGRRRGWDQRRERLGRRIGRQRERDEHRGGSRGGQCGDRERAASGDTGGHGVLHWSGRPGRLGPDVVSGAKPAHAALRGGRLDVAVTVVRAAIVVGVLVAAVTLLDRVGRRRGGGGAGRRVAGGAAGVVAGGAGETVRCGRTAGGFVGAAGWVAFAVAAGFGCAVEEWVATAVLPQPATNAISRAIPAAGRVRVNDMAFPLCCIWSGVPPRPAALLAGPGAGP